MSNAYYELHITVAPHDILKFSAFCREREAKPLYIELNKGVHRHQAMLAVVNHLPGDEAAVAWANAYAANVIEPHFKIDRVKLESRLVVGPNEYYEAHWKLEFPRFPEGECRLEEFLETNPNLLRSWNLFDTRIQYLSQRIYKSQDPIAASETFAASGELMKSCGLPVVKTHYERCVADNNPTLDHGWA